jgi:hypothetical protein
MPNMGGSFLLARRRVCDVQHLARVLVVTRRLAPVFYRPLTEALQPWVHAEQRSPLVRS